MQALHEQTEAFKIEIGVGHLQDDPTLHVIARFADANPVYMLSPEDAQLVAIVLETFMVALDDSRPMPLIQGLYGALAMMGDVAATTDKGALH